MHTKGLIPDKNMNLDRKGRPRQKHYSNTFRCFRSPILDSALLALLNGLKERGREEGGVTRYFEH